MNDCLIKDRKKEIEYLRMALNMCEIGVNYVQTDLILRVIARLEKRRGNMNINDISKILTEWIQDWNKYKPQQDNGTDSKTKDDNQE